MLEGGTAECYPDDLIPEVLQGEGQVPSIISKARKSCPCGAASSVPHSPGTAEALENTGPAAGAWASICFTDMKHPAAPSRPFPWQVHRTCSKGMGRYG